MIKTGAEHALQGGMDLREQAADAVADLRDLRGQVIVKAAQHGELGELIAAGPEGAQGMGRGGAAQACMAASRAQVCVSPGCRSAMRRIASPGRQPTAMPSARATLRGRAPMVEG